MAKNLAEIDKVYGRLNRYASTQEKLKYCSSLIQRTESYVTKNMQALTEHSKIRSFEIIVAAETEIKNLTQKE